MKIRKVLYCLVLVLAGCDVISIGEVEEKFRQNHPNATLVSIGVLEGDSNNAYFQINYRERGLDKNEVWLYQKNKDDEWQLTIVSDRGVRRVKPDRSD